MTDDVAVDVDANATSPRASVHDWPRFCRGLAVVAFFGTFAFAFLFGGYTGWAVHVSPEGATLRQYLPTKVMSVAPGTTASGAPTAVVAVRVTNTLRSMQRPTCDVWVWNGRPDYDKVYPGVAASRVLFSYGVPGDPSDAPLPAIPAHDSADVTLTLTQVKRGITGAIERRTTSAACFIDKSVESALRN